MSEPGTPNQPLCIRRARLDDLPRICAVEDASFPSPWPEWALRREIVAPHSVYLVSERAGYVVGYAGMSVYLDEAHVGTIGVDPDCRRQGIGEALMLGLFEKALLRGACQVILEYRIQNLAAAQLYAKLGFKPNRIRKGYYQDTGEDAVEALLTQLHTPAYRDRLSALRQDWENKHGAVTIEPD